MSFMIAQLVKNPPVMQETPVRFWFGKIFWRRDRLPIPVFMGFPCDSPGRESTCMVGDLGLIPGFGRYPGEGKGYPPQYSGLQNSMDSIVLGVTKNWTQLNDFYFWFSIGHSVLVRSFNDGHFSRYLQSLSHHVFLQNQL